MKTAKKLFIGAILIGTLTAATGCSRMQSNAHRTTERLNEHNNHINGVTNGTHNGTGLLERVGEDVRDGLQEIGDDINNETNRNRQTEVVR
jgi:hypothetical protein